MSGACPQVCIVPNTLLPFSFVSPLKCKPFFVLYAETHGIPIVISSEFSSLLPYFVTVAAVPRFASYQVPKTPNTANIQPSLAPLPGSPSYSERFKTQSRVQPLPPGSHPNNNKNEYSSKPCSAPAPGFPSQQQQKANAAVSRVRPLSPGFYHTPNNIKY